MHYILFSAFIGKVWYFKIFLRKNRKKIYFIFLPNTTCSWLQRASESHIWKAFPPKSLKSPACLQTALLHSTRLRGLGSLITGWRTLPLDNVALQE